MMGGSGQGGNPNAAGGQLGQMANSQTKDPMQNLNRQGAPNFKGPSQQPAQQPYGAVMRDGRIGPDGRVQGRGNDNKFPGPMGDFGLRGTFNPPGQGDVQFMQPMPMRHTGNVGYGPDGKPIGGQKPGSQYGGAQPRPWMGPSPSQPTGGGQMDPQLAMFLQQFGRGQTLPGQLGGGGQTTQGPANLRGDFRPGGNPMAQLMQRGMQGMPVPGGRGQGK